MKNAWNIRNEFKLIDRIAITRETFDGAFTKTKERIEFTFNGWDGKSYEGQTRFAYIYRSNLAGFEDCKFIKVGKGVHYIDEEHLVVNQQTGEVNPTASWVVDVLKG